MFLFSRTKIAIHQISYSPVSPFKQRVILIHSLNMSYFPPLVPSCFLLLGRLKHCNPGPVELFLKCLSLLYERLQTQGWKTKQGSAGPKQILCVECLTILIKYNTRSVVRVWVLQWSKCPRRLLIIMMCGVTGLLFMDLNLFINLVHSFKRNVNEIKCYLINLKV